MKSAIYEKVGVKIVYGAVVHKRSKQIEKDQTVFGIV